MTALRNAKLNYRSNSGEEGWEATSPQVNKVTTVLPDLPRQNDGSLRVS
jgi:hypothetical protein